MHTEAGHGTAEQWMATTRLEANAALADPGDWLTGQERLAVWAEVRGADEHPLDRARRLAISPHAVEGRHGGNEFLPAAAVEVVHRIASDPGRLRRSWADEQIAELGVETYTELVGVTAIVKVIDTYAVSMGQPVPRLPTATAGSPSAVRGDDVGEVGAWVPQTMNKALANVSRALSLVPKTNEIWRNVVNAHYSRGGQFLDLEWDRALSRVQVEAIAARTTSALDCFY